LALQRGRSDPLGVRRLSCPSKSVRPTRAEAVLPPAALSYFAAIPLFPGEMRQLGM